MTKQTVNVVGEVNNVIDAVVELDGNKDILLGLYHRINHEGADAFTLAIEGQPVDWDKLLMEMQHDFEDGLKSIKALREAFDAQEVTAK